MSDAPLMLSVSGLRGIVGRSLTPAVAVRFAAAFGDWLKHEKARGGACSTTPGPVHVVLGRDSRPSGAMLEMAAASALAAAGCRVTRLGVLSTPGVAIMVEHLNADAGMVITASHNPIIWNGMKPLLRVSGRIQAPPVKQANEIIERFRADIASYVTVEDLVAPGEATDGPQVHAQAVLKHVDVEAIRAAKLKVVVDGVHGAAGAETALLMRELGVELVHLWAEPTGRFPHTPEPTKENLTALCDAMRQHKAHLGFAQDPDADRLAIVDERGTYIGEEYTLALACLHLLQRSGPAARGAKLVANLSTSRMIDDIASRYGAQVLRTPVGEANVASVMQKEAALAGGEGNGGVIYPPVTLVRDSLVGMALVLEMLARRRLPLSDIVREVPSYAIVKDKAEANRALIEKISPLLQQAYAQQQIDTQDGVRVNWPDRWVHVRPSNTEPIVRFIAEATSEDAAAALIADARRTLGCDALGGVTHA